MSATLSNVTGDAADAGARATPCLFRVLAAHRPHEAPARHLLAALDELEVGRGASRGWRRDGARLRIDLDDGWASERHARFARHVGRWQVEDCGSKNGVLVNGHRVDRTALADGDVIEIGRTFFVFAAEVEVAGADDAGPEEPLAGLATLAPALAQDLAQLAAVAASAVPVMLRGETGTGKEVAARAIHAASRRRGDFVAVNCGAIPRDLAESTLFGHRRGAFSGAVADHLGAVRAADGGTLFLDEIGDLPPSSQATLLRILQEREVTPVGASHPVAVDLRVVSATHRDVSALRADLVYRLRGFVIALPALAARRCDLGLLVSTFLRRAGGAAVTLHPRAARALLAHPWPGNVRELEQAVAAAVALCGGGVLNVEHLPTEVARAALGAPPPADPDDVLRAQLVTLLGQHRGNVRAIARELGKDPVQVRRWLRRFDLDADAYR